MGKSIDEEDRLYLGSADANDGRIVDAADGTDDTDTTEPCAKTGIDGNGRAGDTPSSGCLSTAASAAAISAGPFLRGGIGAAAAVDTLRAAAAVDTLRAAAAVDTLGGGAALGDADELLLLFLVKNLLKKPGFDVRGSAAAAAFLNTSKRFASALLSNHVFKFCLSSPNFSPIIFLVALKPCAPFFPIYFIPFVRAYNAGAPVLSFSLFMAFFSNFVNLLL